MSYPDTFANFNALDDTERTKIVKDGLNERKKDECTYYDVAIDTPDEELVAKFTEKINEISSSKMKFYSQEQIWSYKAMENNFMAKTLKNLWEQFGSYKSDDGRAYISVLEFMGSKVHFAFLGMQNGGGVFEAYGLYLIDQTASFTLEYENEKVKCTFSNLQVQEGNFTLTTEGDFTGTFQMKFEGYDVGEIMSSPMYLW